MQPDSHSHRFGRGTARRPRTVGLPLALGAAVIAGGIALVDPGTHAQDADALDGTRATLEKWVETRRLMAEARRDWRLGRQILEDRIDAVRREVEALREDTEQDRAAIAEADVKRDELVAENERLKSAATALHEIVAPLEAQTLDLVARLPDPLRESLQLFAQEIPADPEEVELSLSQRFQNVIAVLNEVNRFHREITVATERRDLPDGTTAEVTTVYLGIAQGFYVGRQGTVAGIGSGTPDGWTWRTADDIAPDVARLVAILRNDEVADFIRLPVRVGEGGTP